MFVGFESLDCLRLNLDEYGTTDERFIFKLIFMDTYDNEYVAVIEDGFVFAKGTVLWKVQEKVKMAENRENTFRKWFSL
ncbi:hypothetical protein HNQ80_004247 [Anaerosolibacter carboniphilus]|uniref:Uncharacterized protein n=1 Tax=Anaerosolibacter carboniphilus TaxID=1417629 RepID=A0A841KXN2_9FIRM|nr:hypothetical protein [Anaerosolibacter carboniphilus]